MKQLYINDQRLIIDESNTYFPYTYTINDLENINIINLPISKDIEIPRCATNDEIFGYIGDLTRITSSSDNNLIGVSFNQTKKCIYKLMSDSEIVSEGLLIVKSVNNDSYTIQLLDKVIDKLENLNDKKLNEIDLYDSNNQIIEFISNADNVLSQKDLIPTFNYNETDLDKSNISVMQKDTTTNELKNVKFELSSECEALQVRTFKSYEVKYALPIQKIFNSINLNNLGTTITFDDQLNVLFDDVHILLNKPTNLSEQKTDNLNKSPNANLLGNSAYFSLSPNSTGTGTSVLKNDEVNPYYTATPDANKSVSLFGNQYTYIVGNKYINSIWVRHHHSSNITFTLYNNNNQTSSSKNTIVEPNKWTQITTNAYINTYASASYNILATNVNGKSVDYKMSKIEQVDNLTDTATLWTRSVSDTTFNYDISTKYKQSVNKSYNVDGYYWVDKLFYRPFSKNVSMKENGNYYFDLNFTIDFKQSVIIQGSKTLTFVDVNTPDSNSNALTKTNYVWSMEGSSTYSRNVLAKDGDYIGSLWLKNRIGVYTSKYKGLTEAPDTNNSIYVGNEIVTEIKLFYNVNCSFDLINHTMQVNGHYLLKTDLYPYKYLLDPNKDVFISIELSEHQPYNESVRTRPFGSNEQDYKIKINSSKVTYKTNDIRSGDLINASKICPKIGIKDFIIAIVKYFNLGLKVKDENLHIFKKTYIKINEPIIIDTIDEINVGIIDFNKLKLSTNVPESDLMTEYKSITNEIYGQKNINTGYSIKETVKEVKYDVTIPFLFKDTNTYAYNEFMQYYNGGFNYNNHSNVNGCEDKIVLGYLNLIDTQKFNTIKYNKNIHISDDSDSEIKNIITNVEDNDFCHSNLNILIDKDNSMYYNSTKNDLSSYYTFSPYKFNENNSINKSLELNKPKFIYSDINDSSYPESATHYDLYFKKQINDKYNVNTHIIKTKMYVDINSNVFNIYNYKNSNYIISKLLEYDPTVANMYEVELMKVNDITNYMDESNQILSFYLELHNPTSKNNNNGIVEINFTKGSGNYTLDLYRNGLLHNTGNTTNSLFIFDNLTGGDNYKLKINDGINISYREFTLKKVGILTTTYSYTIPTNISNNDATLTVNITDGVPGYSISILNSNTYEVIQSVTDIKNISYTFYNLRSGIPYLVIISDNSIDNDNVNINLTIENIKNFVYTTKQNLIFDGNITGYSNYFNNITNDFYIKETTGLTFNKINSNLGGTHTLTYNSGTNKTTLYQENVNNNYLIENKSYNFKLVNNTFNYNANVIPVEYNLYDTGVINFNATNTTSAGNLIMNNSLGYGNITLEVGNQNFYGIYITPIINSIVEYSDGAYKMILYNYYQSLGGIKRIDNYTDFMQGNIAFEYNNGGGWGNTGEIAGTIVETGFYSDIYWQKIEVDFGYTYFSSLPVFNTNLRNVKFTKKTEGIYDNIILTFIGSDFNNIYVRLNNGEVYYAYQSEENKNSYTDLVGDNGTPPTSINLLNYNCVIDYTIS